jgi:hypothetical protein
LFSAVPFGGLRVRSSIIASSGGNSDCVGSITAQGSNFDRNSTCTGFGLHGASAAVLNPAAIAADGTWSQVPRYGGALINAAADCELINASTETEDQHDIPRPQGNACDVGAVETDYVFADGFE